MHAYEIQVVKTKNNNRQVALSIPNTITVLSTAHIPFCYQPTLQFHFKSVFVVCLCVHMFVCMAGYQPPGGLQWTLQQLVRNPLNDNPTGVTFSMRGVAGVHHQLPTATWNSSSSSHGHFSWLPQLGDLWVQSRQYCNHVSKRLSTGRCSKTGLGRWLDWSLPPSRLYACACVCICDSFRIFVLITTSHTPPPTPWSAPERCKICTGR